MEQLRAVTEPGQRLVRLAEELAAAFEVRADQHDREGSYPFENIEALRASGYLNAPIGEDRGGMGLNSVHDMVVAASRLAQGDPAVTIGSSMHLIAVAVVERFRAMAARRGSGQIAAGLGMLLQKLVRDRDVISVAISEPDQDLTRPKTAATPAEGGYRIDGHKIFATMSPAATMFLVSVRYPGGDGDDWATNAWVPAATPGVTVNDDWDALGMRASGSGSVHFEGAQIPAMFLPEGRPAGIWAPRLFEEFITSGPMHAAASLGIAEAAHRQIVDTVRRRSRTGTMTVQMLTAENAIDLFAMRSALARAASLVDDYYARNPDRPDDCTAVRDVFAEGQAAKAFINQAAVRLVDRALTMSGGSGYLSINRLSRLYRDVRAGGFMHPFGLNLAYEFIARTELDMEPPLPRVSPDGGRHAR